MRALPVLLAPLLLSACAGGLPDGWEGALLVGNFTQSECLGDPYEVHDEAVHAESTSSTLELDWTNAHFRCEQELEAYYLVDASTVEFLVRPLDMSPSVVARCDCLYDVAIRVPGQFEALDTVRLWRQWDDLNEPNDPVVVTTLTAQR